MRKKVDIFVVNWNSGDQTLQAIKPFVENKSEKISCNIIIVDNASSDNSTSLLKQHSGTTLIINDENKGFGKACNQAYKVSSGEYILLLNPDTLSTLKVLEDLVTFLEENPEYAVTGPQQLNDKGEVSKTCARFPTFITAFFQVTGLSIMFPKVFTPAPLIMDWDHKESREVDQVMGSYMLIRRSVIEQVGFMDEDYFVYTEDTDLSKRLHDAGYKSYFNTSCIIFHESGGTGYRAAAKRLFYSIDARRIYWKKHLFLLSYIFLIFLSLTIEPILRMINSLAQRKSGEIKEILKAYKLYIRKLFLGK